MRRKILIGMLIFVLFAIVAVAKADPIVVIELGLDVVPPGEITLEVCETIELKWIIENILHPEVYYVTLTAAIQNNTLLEIVTAPHYNATYEVYDPDGNLLNSGTVGGVLTMEQFAYWDSAGLKLFEMVTWHLPDSVVLPGDGGYINFSFPVHCEDIGTTKIVLFPRATENHGEPITDLANLYQDKETGVWYPLRGSYDPWDADINSGHSFNFNWWRQVTTTAFAKALYTVIQVPPAPRPSIDVEKTGPTMAHEGDEITYEIIVNNTGNRDLYNVSVYDTLLGDLTGYLPDTTLEVDEVNTFNVDYTVPTPQVSDVENNVTASGEDELGTPVSDSAIWTVEILHPNIAVDKTGPEYAHEGDTITYDINVTNTGDCELTVTVSDPLLGGDLWSGTLAPATSHTFTADYTVPTPADDITNTVTATGVDILGGPKGTVMASDSHFVDILHPDITVEKTGPNYAHEGDLITYTINVTNTGDCELSVTVSDPLLGGDLWTGTLAVGASHVFTADYSVPAPSEEITNTVTATGVDALGGLKGTVTATDDHSVDILHPDITVDKTGPAYAHEGDTITYTINVTNTGDCELTVTVSDPMLTGDLWSGTLASGESHVFTVDYTVPTPSEDITNTVTATGVDALGGPEGTVTATDDHFVDIIHPDITVEKTGPNYAHEGDLITYTINVTNTGDCELTVTVSDPTLGGDLWTGTLAAGASHIFTVNYTVPTPSDDVTNTVTATGVDALGGPEGTVTATDDHSVDILHPGITVDKTGPEYAHEGDLITYTINVTNTGDCELTVTVSDPTLGGDLWTGTLVSSESHTFTVDYTVPTPADDITNTATATGVDTLGGPKGTVTDTDDHLVDVLHPDITVDKTGPEYAHEGDLITYTINVTNTGDCELSVTVSDPLLGGDLWTGTLTAGEFHVFTVNYTVPTPSDDITNTVTATGVDALGGSKGTVTATDDHFVNIIHPDIGVEKTGPTYAHEGDIITYEITVRNLGDFVLYNVTVTDTLLGDLTGYLPDTTLDVGEVNTFNVNYTVPTPQIPDVENTVTASGEDELGKLVSDSAIWTVDILHPSIAVEKTGPDFAHEGDEITYTINVTNTGDCELTVTVSDPLLGGNLWTGTLALGKSHIFTVDYTVPTPSDNITNTVTATGVDALGGSKGTVTATDDHFVDVLHPDITVDKTGPEYAHEGDLITYTINVTNTGDCELTVTVSDPLLGGDLWTGTLTAGTSHAFTVDYTVPTPSEDITNTATATGVDAIGGPKGTVTATDDHFVDIFHPDITVEKTGPNYAHEGDLITYTINVTNTGDCELTVTVSDPLLGGDLWSGTLASGESHIFTVDYTVPAPLEDITNTATATGVDALGGPEGTVTATDDHSVEVLHPGITVDKTGPEYAHEGDLITYTINVTNTGDCELTVTVSDPLLGGDLWTGTLAPSASHIFTVDYTVPEPSGDVTNTVTATGVDAIGGPKGTVTDTDDHLVDVLHPSIDVIKTANATAIHYCDWVEYNVTVVNTGDCPLSVVLSDPMLAINWTGTLETGEKHTEIVTFHAEDDPTVNTASATGTDSIGGVVTDSDSWTVDILGPNIDVIKTANATAIHYCDWVEYNVTVVNTGDSSLSVVLTDTMLGINWSGTLAPGEKHEEIVVFHPEEDPTENTASAVGTDPLGGTVTDSDSWTVDILYPGIDVEKTGPEYAHEGDLITYTINVTNTGDCELTVTVSDPLLGGNLWSGTLASGESHIFTVDYTVPAPSEDITNTVTATGVDALGGSKGTVTATDDHSVDIIHPDITVDKTGPEYAHEGDLITYTINVTNTGDCELSVTVSDPLLGGDLWTGTLAPGASHIFTVDYTVPEPSGDVTNTVTATGVDAIGGPKGTVTDTDDHLVDVLHPGIDVIKAANATAIHYCDWVEYNVTVVNTGDCQLTVVLSDPMLAINWTGTLETGEKHTEIVSFHPEEDPTENTASAVGTDQLGETVTDSDSWTVDILYPGIDVEKTGPTSAHEGDTITYTITVNNTGKGPLYNVIVTDTLLGDLTGYLPDTTLDVGEVNTFNVNYTVPTPQVPDVENTVTASGEDELGTPVSDSASWTVDILHPGIAVEKTGPDFAHEGDEITYTINVTNTGDCELSVTVSDPLLGGDLWTGTLTAGESHVFTVDYTVPAPSEDITNTATATGVDALGGPEGTVTATDDHFVDVLHPDITVDKTGPVHAHEGDTITYDINVTNTGDCDLTVTVSDSLLGSNLWTGTLASDDSYTFSVDYTIPSPSGNVTNTATAIGVDVLGGPEGTVSATDSHIINVLHPSIDVEKTGPAAAHEGDIITYTITVNNTGDCDLYNVNVADTLLGQIYSDGLALGETKTFTVDYTVPAGVDPLVNTVTAEGEDELEMTVTDSASWTVDILHPDIEVTKEGPAMAYAGDTITYTIVISNTGDCPLFNVVVADPMLGPIYSDGLAIDESKTFYKDYTIPPDALDHLVNTVTAEGSDKLEMTVTDSASWSVDIIRVGIHVEKLGPEKAHECDTITYTINVTNTGEDPLTHVNVTDDVLGTIAIDETLAGGESRVFTKTYTIPLGTSDPLVNIVTAEGRDELGATVMDTDTWSVDILRPGIDVEKTGPTSVHEGDTITYTITVNNTGNCPLYNVIVTDTLLGDLTGYLPDNILDVGEVNTFNVTYATIDVSHVTPCCKPKPEPEPEEVVNTVTVEGTDQLGLTVTDSASWTVDIVPSETHPEIHICKCAWPSIIKSGWWVIYKYKVTNTGNCVLYNVEVTDDKLGFIDWIGTLDVGQTVTVKVCVRLFKTTKNIGTATGEDQFGQQVSDSDDAFVYVKGVYCAHTIGYWKNHPCAWKDISPCEEFPWTTGLVEHYTYMEILGTPPEGDASIQLAQQYIAAVLNMHKYGVPQSISETIAAAEAFFEDYPAGSDPQGDARTQAIELASILEDYNSSGVDPLSDDDPYTTNMIWTLGLVTSSIAIVATGIHKRPRRASRSKPARKRTTASN